MRGSFIILLMISLVSGCLKVRDYALESHSKYIDPSTNNSEENIDTTDNSQSIITCGLIEAEPNQEEWTAYLNANLVLNDMSLDTIPAGTYKVCIQFIVDNKGKISNVSVVKNPGHGLGQRVANVILGYKGHWEPAGEAHPVKSYRLQPVTFIVEEEKECENELPAGAIL
jgi:hypothetical protein